MTVIPFPSPPADPLDIVDHALAWAARGFRIFLLPPFDKEPDRKGWTETATTDAATILDMFTARPGANYGVLCHDLIVVDVDEGKKPGAQAIYDSLGYPPTLTVQSPSGGYHYYFSGPSLSPRPDVLGHGLDIRSGNGFVVGPGSYTTKGHRRAEGFYRVVHDLPVAEAPESLIAACRKPKEKTRDREVNWTGPPSLPGRVEAARRYLENDARPAIEGACGDFTTFTVACKLHDYGVTPAEALELMTEHWNDRCVPPWPLDQLQKKVDNGFRYAENEHGSLAPDRVFAGVVLPEEQPRPKPRLRFLADEDAMAKPDWLVKGLLPRVGVGLLAGQSRVGKTFLALELAGALAKGHDFFGKKVRRPGGTLVIAAEAPGSFGVRLEALRRARLDNADKSTLPIAWQAGGKDDLQALVAEAALTMPERFDVPLRLVIVDTIAAAFLMDDEDDAGEATRVMKSLDAVAHQHGVLVLGIHHYGKSEDAGVRGSSAWTASADVILAARGKTDEKTGNVKERSLAITKSRDGETGPLGTFNLRKVAIGLDEDGDEIAGAVIELTKSATAAPLPPGRPPNNAGAAYLRALSTAMGRAGMVKRISGQDLQVVPQDEVSTEFNAIWNPDDVGDPSGAKRHARRRGAENAERLRLAASRELDDGVFCWLTPQGVSMVSSRTF